MLIGFESEDDWFGHRLENDPRFLDRIAAARASVRAGRGVRLEDLGQRFVEQGSATVRDVMTPVIYKVAVTASVAEAARIMVERQIHRLLVTQGKDPVGIITSMDLLKMVAGVR